MKMLIKKMRSLFLRVYITMAEKRYKRLRYLLQKKIFF